MKVPDRNQRVVVPEVVQTSAMDCGPASLKCVLEGFGIPVSYGRLREACQTDVDGTSIDTVEEVAVQLGLDAEQIMVPADYLLSAKADTLPAIIVVRLPNGITHFVVAWRRLGRFVQVMDPATGRRWPSCEQFLSTVYLHTLPVPAATWRKWAGSDQFTSPLSRKLKALGLKEPGISRMLQSSLQADTWRPLAALEACTRTVEAMVRSRGLLCGTEAAHTLEYLFKKVYQNKSDPAKVLPADYWSVRAAPAAANGEEQVFFRGSVLVHVRGRQTAVQIAGSGTSQTTGKSLSPELVAALEETPSRPGRELLQLLRVDGGFSPVVLCSAVFLAAAGVIVEAVLFRSLLNLGRELGLSGQRLGAIVALLIFGIALLLLEFPIAAGLLRVGRRLETRLRIAFLQKIPRLGDRYFHSRLNSDMAERSHSIHRVRLLPELAGQLLRSSFELVLTAAGIIWLDPRTAPIAILAAVFALALPLMVQPVLAERDLRLRSHVGALTRFYLDAFLGLVPVRTHSAERAMRREHESLLMEWARAGLGLQRAVVWIEGLQFLTGFALTAWLLLDHIGRFGESGGTLLLVYWALNLPVLGQEVAIIAWQYPMHRNVILRLLEPLGALEEVKVEQPRPLAQSVPISETVGPRGVSLLFENVSVRAAGHYILENIDLHVEAGAHVAVVGASGAGKSSLVGVLLGWHRPVEGSVFVNGELLDIARLERLRQQTAWVEPAVQLWNCSLFDNIRYGNPADTLPTSMVFEQANLRALLQKLPDGLQTVMGEGGALVSGGEGQRVRLARAMLKPDVRLAILDEPFRGLDRHLRRDLLARSRRHWQYTTLLCVTHDVGETLPFGRVLVVDKGRIVEDGVPAELASVSGTRYRAMLEAEEEVRESLWANPVWRHLQLEKGLLTESAKKGVVA